MVMGPELVTKLPKFACQVLYMSTYIERRLTVDGLFNRDPKRKWRVALLLMLVFGRSFKDLFHRRR